MAGFNLDDYLAECRQLTLREIQDILPKDERYRRILYDLMLDYPLRNAKALRPALCIATCRALGGPMDAVLRSAATLELYHNAFLIHDDVEDGSEHRRGQPTLHLAHGVPIAVNVGDAMLALALQPLLDNMRFIGMGKALRILQVIARMARESAEGQAIELHWIRDNDWHLTDTDYLRMVYKKTSWYTFITPVLIGGTVTGVARPRLNTLRKFAALLGIAFQIQDDILNLTAEGTGYGKEIAGDLWEGKHTLILMHAVRGAASADREQAIQILAKARPHSPDSAFPEMLAATLDRLADSGELSHSGRQAIEHAWAAEHASVAAVKSPQEIEFLVDLVQRSESIRYARSVAENFASRAAALLDGADWLPPSVHRDFLTGLIDFVVSRER